MKAFDKNAPENKKRYQDKTYKIIPADKAMDLGFHEEKGLKNGRARKVKSKAVVHQKVIVTFSMKMMEYQRFIRIVRYNLLKICYITLTLRLTKRDRMI